VTRTELDMRGKSYDVFRIRTRSCARRTIHVMTNHSWQISSAFIGEKLIKLSGRYAGINRAIAKIDDHHLLPTAINIRKINRYLA